MISRLLSIAAIAISVAGASAASAEETPSVTFEAPERLSSMATRKCDSRTASGLGYSVLRKGEGDSPGETSRVRVAYAGYLLTDGVLFDASDAASFGVNGVIAGFGEGLQLMQRGAEYRICIPSGLGYGARGSGNTIPPNSHLIFYLKLLDF